MKTHRTKTFKLPLEMESIVSQMLNQKPPSFLLSLVLFPISLLHSSVGMCTRFGKGILGLFVPIRHNSLLLI